MTSSGPTPLHDDLALAKACLAGQRAACAEFERRYREPLRHLLAARGASPTEAEDLTRDLLSDCVMGKPGRAALLGSYNGQHALKSWLATCATNQFITLKRRAKFSGELPRHADNETADPFEAIPAPRAELSEPHLVTLLRRSLEAALAACPAESRLMLRLVYIEGLTQREVGRMWNYHESKVSRRLDQAMQAIAATTIAKVRETDPFLVLEWQDFLDLCASPLTGLPW